MPNMFLNAPHVKCFNCGKVYSRKKQRINEANKFGWRSFCSLKCQSETRTTGKLTKCSRIGCNKTFIRQRCEYYSTQNHYCSRSCSAIVNNSRYPKRKAVVRKCLYCGKDFKFRHKYCSKKCQDAALIIPAEYLLNKIKRFVEENKRIPLKREFGNYHAIRGRFGTWNNAIKAAGYDPNPVMFANKHIAKDGHKCDSFAEKIIDDWLFERKIEHKRSVSYPSNNNFTCDFVIGDKWIEFFGLHGELKKYDHLRRRKLNIARKSGVNLIKVYPNDISPISKLRRVIDIT